MPINKTLTLFTLILVALCCCEAKDQAVREPRFAGAFYPGDSLSLLQTVDQMLNQTKKVTLPGPILGLIAPHAGYIYSGHVSAQAYSLLKNSTIERIVIISPFHNGYFNGASVYTGDAYLTPLGIIPVDHAFSDNLCQQSPLIKRSTQGHEAPLTDRGEHALEVQLPFLQRTLKNFKIVPIIMGDQSYATCRALGLALAKTINDTKTIIIASSDLSHFHEYNQAVKKDQAVTQAIQEWDYFNLSRNLNGRIWEACGGGPIVATMIACEHLGATEARLLKYANSGDVPRGDKSSVVGYAAIAFTNNPDKSWIPENEFKLNKDEQEELLQIARRAVEYTVMNGKIAPVETIKSMTLLTEHGAFVTLEINKQLRGCIGYTAPILPLYQTVHQVAIKAALEDPRFPPVNKTELDKLEYSISVLSPFLHVQNIDQIKVGTHGLLIKNGHSEGLLLPQVATEQGWDRTAFLEQTCRKAGLQKDAWKDPQSDIFLFSAFVFGEDKKTQNKE
jgi:AmmeMemoRadiSam system protein B/AmmeMemoRadiSam system protein A